jgi:hypothetical protein
MAISKFKFGQEITSAKLNEIVTFLNTLEALYYNTKNWNDTVDSKVLSFQNKLDEIRQEISGLLESAVPLQTLTSTFLNLKAAYESLVAEDVNAFLTTIFTNPNTVTVDPITNEILVGGVSTGITISDFTTIVGPKGDTGPAGSSGINGQDGNQILSGTTNPSTLLGEDDDFYLNTTTLDMFKKIAGVWILQANLKGEDGVAGEQGATTLIAFRYKSEGEYTLLPNDATKFLEFKTYLNTDTQEVIDAKPWVQLRIRGNEWYPQVTTLENGNIILQWTKDGPLEIPSVNLKGPQGERGPKGDKGDSGETFTILGIYATLTALETAIPAGAEGDAYAVGNATDGYEIYIWNTVASPAEWSSIGNLQQPVLEGFSPTFNATVTTLSEGSSATVTLTYDSVDEEYDFAFGIPRGNTGTRGSRIFLIDEGESEPTIATWEGTTLILGDTFINTNDGFIKRVAQITPSFILEEVYQLPIENRLAYRPKALESINKGDLIQYVAVSGGHKLVAKASQTSRTIGSYTVQSCNDYPELIMGVAEENVSANSFFNVLDWGQINNADEFNSYIDSFPEGSILYFDAAGSTPGRLTNVEPTGNTHARLIVAAWIGGPQDIMQVRLGHAIDVADVKGLQTALDGKANTSHTHLIADVTGLQTALDGKASTTHGHLQLLFSAMPFAVSNTSPYSTVTLSSTITSGDRLLIIWGNTSTVKFRSEVFLINTSLNDYIAVLEKTVDYFPGGDITCKLSIQMGTSTTSGAYTGTQITFRNGLTETTSGTQTSATMYVSSVYKVVL